MRFQSVWRPILLSAAVLALGTHAFAQGIATNFDQLGVLVKGGDSITMTGSSGGVFEGRILDVSPSTLTLDVGGHAREFVLDDVRTISRSQHASLGKGAAWGFGIGAGWALVGLSASGNCNSCGGIITTITLTTGAMGAGIGTGIAAVTVRDHVIFANPSTSSVKWSAGPILGRERAGVKMTVRW
jgi:hypothetical protein